MGVWPKLPHFWKWQGGSDSHPKLPPLQGGSISAEGREWGGVVNFKVLEDSGDSHPVGVGVRGEWCGRQTVRGGRALGGGGATGGQGLSVLQFSQNPIKPPF